MFKKFAHQRNEVLTKEVVEKIEKMFDVKDKNQITFSHFLQVQLIQQLRDLAGLEHDEKRKKELKECLAVHEDEKVKGNLPIVCVSFSYKNQAVIMDLIERVNLINNPFYKDWFCVENLSKIRNVVNKLNNKIGNRKEEYKCCNWCWSKHEAPYKNCDKP